MSRNLEFFITEDPVAVVRKWAEEKKKSGATSVGSSHDMLELLNARTQYHEPVTVRLSGAWLDQCVQKGVSALLSLKNNPDSFRQPVVTGVEVDLRTCFSTKDFHKKLSIDDRRQLLVGLIGIHARDPRLTILPREGV